MEEKDRKGNLASIFEPKERESSVNYVINNIKDSLLAQQIMPGEKLPSEMELAKLLSVSRGSIREAMKILAAFGIIEIKRGDGTYVTKDFEGKVIFDPLLFSFILSQPAFEELKELRLMLEKYIVRLAIRNQTEQDIAVLKECNLELRSLKHAQENMSEEDLNALLECDLKFHYILAKIAKNRLIEKIYLFVLEYFKPYIKESMKNQIYFTFTSSSSHEKILAAMEKDDSALAELAVEASIEDWGKLMFK